MFEVKKKVIRDNVHGYIEIPEIIVKEIIDTELFQRLRNIEQTSMRALYPAVRHDRFIHSLGVYKLGVQAFHSFSKNVTLKIKDVLDKEGIDDSWWKKNYLLFSLGCILHDCGHAPFSHTLEFIYDMKKADKADKADVEKLFKSFSFQDEIEVEKQIKNLSYLNYQMLSTYNSDNFMYDFLIDTKDKVDKGVGAPHEKLSAILASREFEEPINHICKELLDQNIEKEDLEFIARMIIGCTYKKQETIEASLKNCIIQLLNSNFLDVDGLDYIVRDAYNSGMDSWSIDYHRILESFSVTEITVFEKVDVKEFDIDGIWLGDSLFQNEKWEKGSVIGSAGFYNFKDNDIDYISFDTNSKYESGYIIKDLQIVNSKDTSKAKIDYAKAKFDLKLKKSCRLSGNFTGTITGKFLGTIPDNNYSTKIEYNLAFNKKCISVIQSAIDARNHEYLWIYSHPKVLYNTTFLQCYLLRLCAKFMCCKKNNINFLKEKLVFSCNNCECTHETEEDIIMDILGLNSLFDSENTTSGFEDLGYSFYRSNDNDLVWLFKSIYYENKKRGENCSDEIENYFSSYFSRRHKKPIWKSFIEFVHFFSDYPEKEWIELSKKITKSTTYYKTNFGFIKDEIKEELKKHGISNAVCVKSKLKTKELDPNSTFVLFNEKSVRLCDLLDKSILKNKYEKEFFYVYGDFKNSLNYYDVPSIVNTIIHFANDNNKHSSDK